MTAVDFTEWTLLRLAITALFAEFTGGNRRRRQRGQVLPPWVLLTAISVAAAAAIGGALYLWMTGKSNQITSQ